MKLVSFKVPFVDIRISHTLVLLYSLAGSFCEMDTTDLEFSVETLLCDCDVWCNGTPTLLRSAKTWYRHNAKGHRQVKKIIELY